ncbi:MAG: GTPase HflX [Spirochaetaceae bacterium]|jgi:GTP-binding protein HflX|nr:GTPase HflX [Spirochaetaceae bacterium]
MKTLRCDTTEKPKRAFLITMREEGTPDREAESRSGEFRGLAESLGVEIAAQETVRLREPRSRFGTGTGKARELGEKAGALGADCLILDWEPSPSQQRNWEALAGIPVIDRQELIIRIFAERAKTKEAALQVELAELSYALPRLNHRYIDLSRQRGGSYGTRGAGETRFETDRRIIEGRIHKLREELEEVRKHRGVQRKKRGKTLFSCALVGYTNSGKSSLLNALTGAGVLAEDKLFATLDPTARRLPGKGQPVMLIDTVGFIRRLPHNLVDAFRATLEEAALADLLIHVVDVSDPDAEHYFDTTMEVLRDLGADKKPMITALNKIDRADPAGTRLPERYAGGVPVSARTGQGLEELTRRLRLLVSGSVSRFRFPRDRYDLAALLHRDGRVLSEKYEDAGIEMEARVGGPLLEKLRDFTLPPQGP